MAAKSKSLALSTSKDGSGSPTSFDMMDSHSTDFVCSCGARYRVVQVKTDTDPSCHGVRCLACQKPLVATTKGGNILKYFLVGPLRS